MTVVGTMTMVGLLGLALHFGYHWIAGALVVLFLVFVIVAKRSGPPER